MKQLGKEFRRTTIITFLISSFILSSLSFASDYRLTRDEFLDRVKSNSLSLDRSPVFAVPPAIMNKMVEVQKRKFPDMTIDNLYYYYYRDNSVEYSLFWEWDRVSCRLRIEELDKTTHRATGKTADPEGQKVDKKYCDKVYGKTL